MQVWQSCISTGPCETNEPFVHENKESQVTVVTVEVFGAAKFHFAELSRALDFEPHGLFRVPILGFKICMPERPQRLQRLVKGQRGDAQTRIATRRDI